MATGSRFSRGIMRTSPSLWQRTPPGMTTTWVRQARESSAAIPAARCISWWSRGSKTGTKQLLKR